MFELTWQEFIRRPHVAKLSLHEQMQQFNWEQQRYHLMMEYVINTSTATSAAAGAAAGGGSGEIIDPSFNSYVENNYIDNYFE